jgi:hypothetical protein
VALRTRRHHLAKGTCRAGPLPALLSRHNASNEGASASVLLRRPISVL